MQGSHCVVFFAFSAALLAHAARIGALQSMRRFFVSNSGSDDGARADDDLDWLEYHRFHNSDSEGSRRSSEAEGSPRVSAPAQVGGLISDRPRDSNGVATSSLAAKAHDSTSSQEDKVCKSSPQLVSDLEELARHDAVAEMLPRMIPPGLVDDVWSSI
jgi:hypothetical protein